MRGVKRARRILMVTYLIALHGVVGYLLFDRFVMPHLNTSSYESAGAANSSIAAVEQATTYAEPSITGHPTPARTNADQTPMPGYGRLIIPVPGVRPEQLVDTFMQARSEGRVHDAIDIPAAAGTPVLAAADGEIIKFFDSQRGGTTIYQLSADRKLVYYYAHLQARAEDVKAGDTVKQGKTIGFVGDTGNAGAGNYHLHFSIAIVTDPKRYWEGTYIDPYPYLKSGTAPQLP